MYECTNFKTQKMYVYVYICQNTLIQDAMNKEVCTCIHEYMYIYQNSYISISKHLYTHGIYMSIRISSYMNLHIPIYMNLHISIYMTILIYMNICKSIYVDICISICMKICVSIYVNIHISICMKIYLPKLKRYIYISTYQKYTFTKHYEKRVKHIHILYENTYIYVHHNIYTFMVYM